MHTRYSYGPEEAAVSVRHGLLALLAEGPSYGYQLRTRLLARTGGTWPLNIGQVYTTLSRLERDGLVEATGADGQATYRITEAGRAAVAAWFAGPVNRPAAVRDELAIKLALAVDSPAVDASRIVRVQRAATARAVRELVGLRSGADAGAGLRALLPLGHVELDALTLFEGLVPVHLDGRVVDEHVLTAVHGDEAVALLGVEPLHGALCHVHSYLGAIRPRTARSPGLRRRSRTCRVHALPGRDARVRNLNFDRAGRYTIADRAVTVSAVEFCRQSAHPRSVHRPPQPGVRDRGEGGAEHRERDHDDRPDDLGRTGRQGRDQGTGQRAVERGGEQARRAAQHGARQPPVDQDGGPAQPGPLDHHRAGQRGRADHRRVQAGQDRERQPDQREHRQQRRPAEQRRGAPGAGRERGRDRGGSPGGLPDRQVHGRRLGQRQRGGGEQPGQRAADPA